MSHQDHFSGDALLLGGAAEPESALDDVVRHLDDEENNVREDRDTRVRRNHDCTNDCPETEIERFLNSTVPLPLCPHHIGARSAAVSQSPPKNVIEETPQELGRGNARLIIRPLGCFEWNLSNSWNNVAMKIIKS